MLKRIALLLTFSFLSSIAFAQSNPGLVYGQIPTAGQWNSYFSAKQDYWSGGLPINRGGTGATTVGGAQTSLGIGSAGTYPIGTSGATVPLNNGGFTQSGLANFTGGLQIGGVSTGTMCTQDASSVSITGGSLSGVTLNKVTVTAPATGSTLTIADGATLSAPSNATVSGTNTGDQTITLSGDVTGTGTGGISTTLSSVVTAGGPTGSSSVVPVITYDAKGRLTTVSTATVTPSAIGAPQTNGTGASGTWGIGISGNAATATSATTASTVTTGASTTNSAYSILSAPSTTGNQQPYTVSGLTINPSTGAVALPGALSMSGAFTGATSSLTGAGANTINLTRSETGAVVTTALSKLKDSVTTRDFGAVCDGTTDDTTAFQNAVNAAINYNGVLHVTRGSSGVNCKINGIVTVTASTGAYNQLLIIPDSSITITFNGATGGFKFDGGGTGGRLNYSGFVGGHFVSYAAGSGWAVWFQANDRAVFMNAIVSEVGHVANGVYFDNVYHGIAWDNYIDSASVGIQFSNITNDLVISGGNEIVNAAIAIYSPSGSSANNANFIVGNYIELNADGVVLLNASDDSTWVKNNYINQSSSSYDIVTTGNSTFIQNNSIVNSTALTNIKCQGANNVITGNIGRTNTGSDYFIRLHAGCYGATVAHNILSGSTIGSFIDVSLSTSNTIPIASNGTTTISGTSSTVSHWPLTGGTSQVLKQTTSGGPITVARLAASDLSDFGSSASADSAMNIGGVYLKTGSVVLNGTTPVTITFPAAFPTSCDHIVASLHNQQETFTVVCASASTATITGSVAGTPTASYIAIGH